MKLAVVTVAFNSGAVIEEFLSCCEKQQFTDYLLIVVDNNSQDTSMKSTRAYEGKLPLKIIALAENVGVAEGNNVGISHGLEQGSEYILLLNNDVTFNESFFGDLVGRLEQAADASVLVPKINYYSPANMIWYAGGKFVFYAGPLAWHLGEGDWDSASAEVNAFVVNYAPTCAMLIRSAVFRRVGLMDKKYFVYWDDTDFCYRLLKHQERILYDPSVLMYHKVSSLTGGGKSAFSIKMYSRNQVYFVRKHFNMLRRWYYYFTIHAMNLLRLINGKDNSKEFVLRTKSFLLGFDIPVERS